MEFIGRFVGYVILHEMAFGILIGVSVSLVRASFFPTTLWT